jgi:hypothetical protein
MQFYKTFIKTVATSLCVVVFGGLAVVLSRKWESPTERKISAYLTADNLSRSLLPDDLFVDHREAGYQLLCLLGPYQGKVVESWDGSQKIKPGKGQLEEGIKRINAQLAAESIRSSEGQITLVLLRADRSLALYKSSSRLFAPPNGEIKHKTCALYDGAAFVKVASGDTSNPFQLVLINLKDGK